MIQLLHQREQTAQFTGWETLAGKPVKVMPRQVGNDTPFVFAIGHDAGDQKLQGLGFHRCLPGRKYAVLS